ncbi:hypothetical protein HJG60_010913 [Phyllostomus discolor]|uniref:Uncharacterized protein n=1 Tax=Phyllostomus discolor TaxID=89673 RepID=A0A834A7U7_9CHIR|nr:hypothetical protein HJG60_010913 [Phyllostomus discolor]
MPSSLPRMRMQSQQQTIKRHSASPSFHPLFTLLFSSSASSGRYIRYLLYPSSAPLSGTVTIFLFGSPPPRLNPGSSPSWVPTAGPLCRCPAEKLWAPDGQYY